MVFSSAEILRHPFSVTVFEDWLYWSDWDSNAIYRANKFNGSGAAPMIEQVFRSFYRVPRDILSEKVPPIQLTNKADKYFY